MAEYAVHGKKGAAPAEVRPAIEQVLRSCSLFANADAELIAKIAGYCEIKSYSAGATIIRAGAPATTLGILVRGKAHLTAVNALTGEQRMIEELQVGDPYGDVGVVLETAHQDSVVAQTACAVIELSTEVFGQLCAKLPGVGHSIARRLAMRLVRQNLISIRGTESAPIEAVSGSPPRGAKLTSDLIPFVFISDFNPSEQLFSLVPITVMREHQCVPLVLRDRKLTLGLVNPRNPGAISSIRRLLQNVDVEIVAVSADDLTGWLGRLKPAARGASVRQKPGISAESLKFESEDAGAEISEKEARAVDEEVARLASRIIAEGIAKEVSEIHIEADRAGVKVRFRKTGTLIDYPELIPSSFAKSLVARIQSLAGLDAGQTQLPQDGRLGVLVGGREIDLRVSTIPAVRAAKVVMRLHDAASMLRPLDQVFLDPHVLDAIRRAITGKGKAIIVAGGAGSGRSSSLYSMVTDRMKSRADNVVMVEDPIEFRLAGTTQAQVNPRVGLDFATLLRAGLRQHPDVIVVGETRDPESARLVTEAAVSGHLLLTAIHADDCISVIQRLEDFGCARALIAKAYSLIVVQRLAPRLCRACVRTELPSPIMLGNLAKFGLAEAAAPHALPVAVGCDACEGTGYVGRVAVVESLEIDQALQSALIAKTLDELRMLAIESRKLHLFSQSASFLMTRKLLSATDALLTCAH